MNQENYLNPPEAATRESRYETLAAPMGPRLRATMERLHREAAGKCTINPVFDGILSIMEGKL